MNLNFISDNLFHIHIENNGSYPILGRAQLCSFEISDDSKDALPNYCIPYQNITILYQWGMYPTSENTFLEVKIECFTSMYLPKTNIFRKKISHISWMINLSYFNSTEEILIKLSLNYPRKI